MTPDEVRNVVFRKPPIGQRGYREDDVDALLDLIESALRRGDSAADIADIVRKVEFRIPAIGRRGYDRDEVDDFLHLVQSTV